MSRLLIGIAFLLSFSMLQASPLDDARDAGQIIELPNGYVQTAETASAKTKALAAEVNKRRKNAYERIAEKNGITAEQVAIESYKKRAGNP